jgi:hypothetical protein
MLLEAPWPRVEKLDDLNSQRELTLSSLLSPSSLCSVAPREDGSPSFPEKVGNEDDEGTLDSNQCRFELALC